MSSEASPSISSLIKTVAPHTKGQLAWLVAATVVAVIGAVAALLMPQVLRVLVDGPIADGDRSALLPVTLVVLGLGIFEALMVLARRLFTVNSSTRIEFNARMALFRRLVDLSTSFHDRWPSGQLLTRITQDLNLTRRWIAFGVIQLIVSAAMLLTGVVLMATVNSILALIYFLSVGPLIWLTMRFERVYLKLSRQAQDKSGDVATVVEESVKGIRIIKAFGRGPEALEWLGTEAGELRDLEVKRGQTEANLMRSLVLIPNLTIGACLLISAWFASLGWVSLGGVVAFFATVTMLRVPIQAIGFLLAFSLEALSAIARYKEVIEEPVTIDDPDDPVALASTTAGARLTFDEVTFRFSDQGPEEPPVFDHLNLEVAPGERLALVGLTGSGKSTLLLLAARLHDVTGGSVQIDGVDVRDLTRVQLREQMAVTFEDPTLFSASIRDNVALGAPELADAQVAAALDVASADFVERLPNGTETVIGEEGQSLSGGQRQRLALARAVAMSPRLMLLDDPLSALDVHTEQTVTHALDEVLGDTTALIVAHRPSTVALADRVALLDHGRIVETGTHSELLATSERYRYVISSMAEEEAR